MKVRFTNKKNNKSFELTDNTYTGIDSIFQLNYGLNSIGLGGIKNINHADLLTESIQINYTTMEKTIKPCIFKALSFGYFGIE